MITDSSMIAKCITGTVSKCDCFVRKLLMWVWVFFCKVWAMIWVCPHSLWHGHGLQFANFVGMKVSLRSLTAAMNTACLQLVADLLSYLQSAADMALQSGMAKKPEQ